METDLFLEQIELAVCVSWSYFDAIRYMLYINDSVNPTGSFTFNKLQPENQVEQTKLHIPRPDVDDDVIPLVLHAGNTAVDTASVARRRFKQVLHI
jgi:hypothetical protein